ncbi:uncharacterized protein PG998_014609 [Apiospora kogelbergensis]|uniref:uncharacterized protein n=1 Tax=Apiospora kogelbergensis TaxID=1337665 RepID=UPI00312DB96A
MTHSLSQLPCLVWASNLVVRPLQRQSDRNSRLAKDLVDAIPPYAIFSHTWFDADHPAGLAKRYVEAHFLLNQEI